MSVLLHLILLIKLFSLSRTEWVNVDQKSLPQKNSQKNINQNGDKGFDTNTPSPAWVAYQHERYGNSPSISTNQSSVNNTSPAKPVKQKVETTSRQDMNNDYEFDDETENNEENSNENGGSIHNNNGIQYPSINGFIKFLTSLRTTWIRKSAFTIKQKINLLKNLRDSLMHIIEKKFSLLWQPKVYLRRKRGILEESNLEFPPEASLISISFLTFAVFLIKLVLRVVHIVKSKHYNFTGYGITSDILGKTTTVNF
ncbi:uncharacterized protein LOC119676778 [Teleopsis dalmanni]|uniref:uncharacterized protein LOC119676778 n=1 Tax=Teleopsis dalmanni TaxID=139649 RepID=UPI0018CD433C|nr:uncharacterized protein LOC119676778 [Teleopsis dalmanni]